MARMEQWLNILFQLVKFLQLKEKLNLSIINLDVLSIMPEIFELKGIFYLVWWPVWSDLVYKLYKILKSYVCVGLDRRSCYNWFFTILYIQSTFILYILSGMLIYRIYSIHRNVLIHRKRQNSSKCIILMKLVNWRGKWMIKQLIFHQLLSNILFQQKDRNQNGTFYHYWNQLLLMQLGSVTLKRLKP